MNELQLKRDANRVIPPASTFGASSWKYIFKLLGLVVVADGVLLKEELDAYQDAIVELATVIDPKLVMTRKMAFDWFVNNKADLVAIIDGLAYDDVLIDLFSQMRHLPHKLDVVTAMVKIAISDGDYHAKEQLFIKKTILYWNVRGGDVHENVLKREAITTKRISAITV